MARKIIHPDGQQQHLCSALCPGPEACPQRGTATQQQEHVHLLLQAQQRPDSSSHRPWLHRLLMAQHHAAAVPSRPPQLHMPCYRPHGGSSSNHLSLMAQHHAAAVPSRPPQLHMPCYRPHGGSSSNHLSLKAEHRAVAVMSQPPQLHMPCYKPHGRSSSRQCAAPARAWRLTWLTLPSSSPTKLFQPLLLNTWWCRKS